MVTTYGRRIEAGPLFARIGPPHQSCRRSRAAGPPQPGTFHEISTAMHAQRVRHTGPAVLDLCCVACGRVDALWEFGPRPWDVAARALIVTEAGGQVTNLDGSALDLDGRRILACNGKLHRAMRKTIARAWPEADRRQSAGHVAV